ncbi:hypothetical protein JKP75_05740 [Blastococcus sp. TML/M2B]|uniref:hypothetical protein n=1 Tax=unclassified Blastococcus TaxID=2619396 RepID=UPI001909A28E|nr:MULTISPECIES: hypothetical protein [unclassified Blastococcus]MBN1092109.1 hypothetical protein [Blastococcus sp. TML/M2B]MBN1097786.1 hypothetical protein [Blastococcus sp. TML/C7B]
MSTGPFLYDEGPAPLHTGVPQRSGKLLVLIMGGTVLVALLVVVLAYLIRGSGSDQATEVSGVFLTALAAGDTETAHALLCEEERARLEPTEVADAYLGQGEPELGEVRRDGDARVVPVRWSGGGSAELTVIGQDGLRICGVG